MLWPRRRIELGKDIGRPYLHPLSLSRSISCEEVQLKLCCEVVWWWWVAFTSSGQVPSARLSYFPARSERKLIPKFMHTTVCSKLFLSLDTNPK